MNIAQKTAISEKQIHFENNKEDKEEETKQNEQFQFNLYPYRFIIALCFAIAKIGSAIQLSSFTPIAQQLSVIYEKPPWIINFAILIIHFINPLVTFPASQVLDKYGLQTGIRIGAVFVLIGSGTKLLVNQSFFYVIAGFGICGIGFPFMTNGITKISAQWFAPESRNFITTFIMISIIWGAAFTGLQPGQLFEGYEAKNDSGTNQLEGKNKTFTLFKIIFIATLILELTAFIFIKNKPDLPPSRSANAERMEFQDSFKSLFKNKNQQTLCAAYGFLAGAANSQAPIMSQLVKPFGQTAKDVSIMKLMSPISGVFGGIFANFIVKKWKKYQIYGIIVTSIKIALTMIKTWALYIGSMSIILISLWLVGFCMVPLHPLLFELACEVSFPVGEAMATGFLESFSRIYTFIFGICLSLFVNGETQLSSYLGYGLVILLNFVGIIFLIFTKDELRKMNLDLNT